MKIPIRLPLSEAAPADPGVTKNISTAKNSTSSLSQEELYRMIVENAVDFAIFTLDLDGRVMTWNSGAERILGFTAAEMIGNDASIIFTSDDRKQQIPEQEIHDAFTKGRAQDKRWHLRKNGETFWADGVMVPLQDGLGIAHGFVKIIQDRTAEVLAQEALQYKEKEIIALKRSLG